MTDIGSQVVRVAQWAYHKAHKVIFKQIGSYDLTIVLWKMAQDTNLLNSKIHEVQEVWTGQRGFKAANYAMQTSPKGIQFFRVVSLNKSLNIMGLKGVHSPEALHQWGSCSFCHWCRKEGQNEATVMNHLRTMHYHLGLVCALSMDFFSTSVDTMMQHAHMCKSTATTEGNDQKEEEYKNDYNGNKDDEYLLKQA